MRKQELTFDAVDDLVGAYARGKLDPSRPAVHFVPAGVGPLIELNFESTSGRHGPLLRSAWLDKCPQRDLRTALVGSENVWLDELRHRGFLRTVFDPLNPNNDAVRTKFLMTARVAAESAGLAVPVAQSLAAAIREMESNIHEHSDQAATGIIAFQAGFSEFEFVVADAGRGVLSTLREAPEFRGLSDHGRALHAALQEGVSRYGRAAHRGNGFRDLFLGLANLNADLRFRSGDHALIISGASPNSKLARLAQKSNFQGFLASVRCRVMPPSATTH